MKEGRLESLEAALARRQPLAGGIGSGVTTAYRLFCGVKEGIPGLVIDRYGDVLVFQFHEGSCELPDDELKAIAEWALRRLSARSVYLKRFVADRSRKTAGAELYSSKPFVGEPSPSEVFIRESGLLYEIHPYEGFSTGLFLDQRENRRFLASQVAGKRVLNCFAYTCGFSLACAAGGAETTSVDLSRKFLEWGKRNFQANRIETKGHRFVAEDTFEFLRRAEKRADEYDLVIVDPPSFSRNDRKVFSIQKDVRRLVGEAAKRVSGGGKLFFSSNYSSWDSRLLGKTVEAALQGIKKGRFEKLPETPIDFQKETHPLSAVFLQLEG